MLGAWAPMSCWRARSISSATKAIRIRSYRDMASSISARSYEVQEGAADLWPDQQLFDHKYAMYLTFYDTIFVTVSVKRRRASTVLDMIMLSAVPGHPVKVTFKQKPPIRRTDRCPRRSANRRPDSSRRPLRRHCFNPEIGSRLCERRPGRDVKGKGALPRG